MKKRLFYFIFSIVLALPGCSVQKKAEVATAEDWPATLPWWKKNNLRLIQTNLPAYEAAILDQDSLV